MNFLSYRLVRVSRATFLAASPRISSRVAGEYWAMLSWAWARLTLSGTSNNTYSLIN